MGSDTNLIIGNGLPNIIRSNPQNEKIEAASFLNVAKTLEENIEDNQRFIITIGETVKGSSIDIFGWRNFLYQALLFIYD